MSEFEMDGFETRLEQRLQRYAHIPVRPVNAHAVTAEAVTARSGLLGRLGLGWRQSAAPAFGSVAVLVILGLILAVTLAVVAASLNRTPQNPLMGSNGLIAFEVGPLGNREGSFHTIKPDGTGELDFGSAKRSRFSTDGKSLVYIRHFEEFPLDSNLLVSEPDGSNERFVAKYAQLGFALSPDGVEIAMPYEDETGFPGQIAAYSVADGSSRELLPAPPGYPDTRYELDSGAWSPDGKYVAVSLWRSFPGDISGPYRVGIVVVDTRARDTKTVSTRMSQSNDIAWSPDSSSIAYVGWADGADGPGPAGNFIQGQSDVYSVDVKTGVETAITRGVVSPGTVRWAPDGNSIAYTAEARFERLVAIVDLDETGRPTTSRGGPVAQNVEWAPDGETLLISNTRAVVAADPDLGDIGVLQIIDRELAGGPRTLVTVNGGIGAISWQRLDPE